MPAAKEGSAQPEKPALKDLSPNELLLRGNFKVRKWREVVRQEERQSMVVF